MIERYFRPGVRFLWNKPNDMNAQLDGAIVGGNVAANNLTYDGLDGRQTAVEPLLLQNHASAVLGLVMRAQVAHTWLPYAPGRIAQVQAGGSDILTGYMSGCLIVRGTYGGAVSAFHVGTIDNNPAANRTVKRSMAQNLPADARGFDAAAAWTAAEIATKKGNLGGALVAAERIFGLVTSTGTFHSCLLFNVTEGGQWMNQAGQRYWCVGGCKVVAPMNRVRLMARLMA